MEENIMRKLTLLSATAIIAAVIAAPALAQEGGAIGPGSRYGLEPEPGPTYYDQGYGGYYSQGDDGYYNRSYYNQNYYRGGFAPLDAAAGLANGAVNTAGAIATAPFRAGNNGAYAAMASDSYCAQRYRSYDPASGTFMGYDGRRHPCND
jgi:hypothetical protein